MNARLLATFDRVENRHWWWAGRRQLIKQLLSGLNVKRVLDIGCGTGQTLLFVKKLFPKAALYGIDFSPLAVKFAKNHGLKNIKQAKAESLPYPDDYFDIVLMLDVIEHIKDDARAVREAKRVLKPDGKLVITTPALSFIWSDHDRNQGHYRRYTRRMMRALAAKNNLRAAFVSYFNFLLSPFIIVVRLLSNLKPFQPLGDYDSKLNFGVAEKPFFNNLLKQLFIFEISLLKWIGYPIGISIAVLFEKDEN